MANTEKLLATITPDNATDKTLTWSSSDESIAMVDNDGTVSAVSVGTAVITATTHNGLTDECDVDVFIPKEFDYLDEVKGTRLLTQKGVDPKTGDLTVEYTKYNDIQYTEDALNQLSEQLVLKGTDSWQLELEYTPISGYDEFNIIGTTLAETTAIGKYNALSILTSSNETYTSRMFHRVNNISLELVVPSPTTYTFGERQNIVVRCYGDNKTHVSYNNGEFLTKEIPYDSSSNPDKVIIQGSLFGGAVGTLGVLSSNAKTIFHKFHIKILTIDAESISLNTNDIVLSNGTTYQLEATVLPEDATDKTVTYVSSNDAVATVDSTGLITTIGAGTCTITASTVNGLEAICTVKSIEGVLPTSITFENTLLNKSNLEESETLIPIILPENANTEVTWSSSNEAVATVDDGVITIHKYGECDITATTINNLSASCRLVVFDYVNTMSASLLEKAPNVLEDGRMEIDITKINSADDVASFDNMLNLYALDTPWKADISITTGEFISDDTGTNIFDIILGGSTVNSSQAIRLNKGLDLEGNIKTQFSYATNLAANENDYDMYFKLKENTTHKLTLVGVGNLSDKNRLMVFLDDVLLFEVTAPKTNTIPYQLKYLGGILDSEDNFVSGKNNYYINSIHIEPLVLPESVEIVEDEVYTDYVNGSNPLTVNVYPEGAFDFVMFKTSESTSSSGSVSDLQQYSAIDREGRVYMLGNESQVTVTAYTINGLSDSCIVKARTGYNFINEYSDASVTLKYNIPGYTNNYYTIMGSTDNELPRTAVDDCILSEPLDLNLNNQYHITMAISTTTDKTMYLFGSVGNNKYMSITSDSTAGGFIFNLSDGVNQISQLLNSNGVYSRQFTLSIISDGTGKLLVSNPENLYDLIEIVDDNLENIDMTYTHIGIAFDDNEESLLDTTYNYRIFGVTIKREIDYSSYEVITELFDDVTDDLFEANSISKLKYYVLKNGEYIDLDLVSMTRRITMYKNGNMVRGKFYFTPKPGSVIATNAYFFVPGNYRTSTTANNNRRSLGISALDSHRKKPTYSNSLDSTTISTYDNADENGYISVSYLDSFRQLHKTILSGNTYFKVTSLSGRSTWTIQFIPIKSMTGATTTSHALFDADNSTTYGRLYVRNDGTIYFSSNYGSWNIPSGIPLIYNEINTLKIESYTSSIIYYTLNSGARTQYSISNTNVRDKNNLYGNTLGSNLVSSDDTLITSFRIVKQ